MKKNWRFTKWMGPVLDAVRALGGTATPKMVQQQIQQSLKLPEELLADKNKSGQTKFYNELHWARQYLVWEGLLDSQERGQWKLTNAGKQTFLDETASQQLAEKWAEVHKQKSDEESDDDAKFQNELPPDDLFASDKKKFTWIPIYEEIAQKILEFENRQDELLKLLQELRDDDLKVIQLNDRDAAGKVIPLAEIDPFTFFASFNRTSSIPGRQAIIKRIKTAWNLSAAVPEDFTGIPLANAQNSWAFAYAAEREQNDVPILWRAAKEGITKTWQTFDRNLFNETLGISQMGLARLSMSLFWMKPKSYLSLDKNTRVYFEQRGIICESKTAEGYFSWLEKIVAKVGADFPKLSFDAYQEVGLSNDNDDDTETEEIDNGKVSRRYWTFSAGEGGEMWEEFYKNGIAAIGWDDLLDLSSYKTKEDLRQKLQKLWPADSSKKNDAHACWQFAHDISIGDVIFAKQGFTKLLGYGIVESDYHFNGSRSNYQHVRKVKWFKGECEMPEGTKLAMKTLTDISRWPDFVLKIANAVGLNMENCAKISTPAEVAVLNPEYPLTQVAEETGVDIKVLQRWVGAVNRKGQAIFYGPPGTGKTFLARKLAQHLIGGGNGIYELVQFHPAYAYEDFMQGLRPQRVNGGLDYPLVPGRFLDFCERARKRDGLCVLIIDEINRANLARVFGELMYLLEYRQNKTEGIPLASGGRFHIPTNVRLIGTMNTADRSIALVDHALRRRFAFLGLAPDFEVLRRFHQREKTGFPADDLIKLLEQLNVAINDPHYSLGISFFMREGLATELPDIWAMEVEPFLEEHFFDQREKFLQFRWEKVSAQLNL